MEASGGDWQAVADEATAAEVGLPVDKGDARVGPAAASEMGLQVDEGEGTGEGTTEQPWLWWWRGVSIGNGSGSGCSPLDTAINKHRGQTDWEDGSKCRLWVTTTDDDCGMTSAGAATSKQQST